MKRRKLLALSLVLCMLLVYIPAPARAATTVDSGTCGDNLTWVLDSDGVLTISGTGDMEDYDEGETPWYDYMGKIQSVVIKSGVTSIGIFAFYDCRSLTSVTIPDSVTGIGNWAFSGTSLTSVTIPDGVTRIGNWAFCYCYSLTSVTIPDSVIYIENQAFGFCTSLTSVTIPDSVIWISATAFSGCSSLEGIWVDNGNANYSSDSYGVLFDKEKTQLIEAPGAISGSYTIPDGVTSVGDDAFCYCASLTGVTIPDGVTSIGGFAFYDCNSLTSVTIPDSVTSIGHGAFYFCDSLKGIWVDNGNAYFSSDSYGVLFDKEKTRLIEAPGAISGSYTIPYGVTSIGDSAFWYCTSLTDITIPASVTSIDDSAFLNCTSLTSVTIPASVTSIGNYAFYCCESLTGVTIPASVTSIGDYAFVCCSRLTNIYFQGKVPTFGYDVFSEVTATAWYPCEESTWTDNVMQDYGGNITWKSYDPSAFTVLSQPTSQKVPANAEAIFSVYATGSGLTYQWQYRTSSSGTWKNATATGNKTAAIKVAATTAKNGYQYRCKITDSAGNTVTTDAAYLYVLAVTTHPASVVAEAGDTVKFTVAAIGDGVTYLWQYLNDNGVWATTTLSGYKTATLSVGATAARDGKQYRCKLTDSAGNVVYSDAASLYVLGVTSQPTMQKVKAGATATFTVTATGHNKTYQWQYRTSSSGTWQNTTLTGNKTATLSVAATTGRSGYQYRCKITDSAGNVVYTNAASLYVLGIKTQPTMQKVKAGATATFTVTATGHNKTYQWQYRTSSSGTWKNATATGNQTATLSVPGTTGRSGYQYRCKITDSAGNVVYTNAASLYVLGIKTQPTSQTVSAGSTATFAVTATGHNKTYQWQYRTSSSGTWQNTTLTGNKTATLSVAATTGRNGYQYRCKITDSAGNVVYTNAVTLTVK